MKSTSISAFRIESVIRQILGGHQALLLFHWAISLRCSMVGQPDTVECISQRCECLFPHFRSQVTLPYGDTVPSHLCEHQLLCYISPLVSADFGHPEVPVGMWNPATDGVYNLVIGIRWGECHTMPMPKTAIYEDTRTIFPQHQVGMAWQPRRIKPVSESIFPQPTAHDHFRFGVLGTDGRHVLMPLFRH